MTQTLTVKDLVARNQQAAEKHEATPYFTELTKPLPKILVITCLDPRLDPVKFLGLEDFDVILARALGGHSKLDDILALDAVVQFREIMLIQHTDCGATHFDIPKLQETLKDRAPQSDQYRDHDFGYIPDLEQSVKKEVQSLRESPLMRKELQDHISGFIFDIKTGKLNSVA